MFKHTGSQLVAVMLPADELHLWHMTGKLCPVRLHYSSVEGTVVVPSKSLVLLCNRQSVQHLELEVHSH